MPPGNVALVEGEEDIVCANCGATVPAEEDRCPSCNIALHVACPECGTRASVDEDVCPACGTSLAHGTEVV